MQQRFQAVTTSMSARRQMKHALQRPGETASQFWGRIQEIGRKAKGQTEEEKKFWFLDGLLPSYQDLDREAHRGMDKILREAVKRDQLGYHLIDKENPNK